MKREFWFSFFDSASRPEIIAFIKKIKPLKLTEKYPGKASLIALAVTFPMFFYSTIWPYFNHTEALAKKTSNDKKQVAAAQQITATPSAYAPVARANSYGWVWPTEGVLFSRWGNRSGGYHDGIDIVNVKGTRIVAAKNGRVVATHTGCAQYSYGCGGGYGNYVIVRHPEGLYSIYAHLSKVLATKGQTVQAGQEIGKMGTSGRSSGVHLHFGIGPTQLVNTRTFNPLVFLQAR